MTLPDDARWIPGHEGFYGVTSDGRVWSEPRERTRGGWLVATPGARGYLYVNLGRRHRARPLHVLIAAAWIGPRPLGQEVRHLDGNKHHNVDTNLAYGTRREQRLDDVRHGVNALVRWNARRQQA